MKINTSRFGEVDVADDLLFELVNPILGYEDETEFVFIEHKGESNLKWLQSTKTPEVAFVITIPGLFGIEYSYELPTNIQEELGIESADDILSFNIVLIPHENPRASTINLLAPVIFNVSSKKGAQVILTGTNFSVNCPLFNNKENEAAC